MATNATPARRALWPLLVLVALVVALVVFASAFVPRWWAHRIGDYTDESFTRGILLGVLLGFVFTFFPLALAAIGLRWARSWRQRLVVLFAAALLAAPNLLTLSVVFGTGNAAHAGDRTLDVQAPGFRGASLMGALAAAALVAAPIYFAYSRGRRRPLRRE
jgi:hypothetical protein